MDALDNIELAVLELTGDVETACGAKQFLEQAIEQGKLDIADLADMDVIYEHVTMDGTTGECKQHRDMVRHAGQAKDDDETQGQSQRQRQGRAAGSRGILPTMITWMFKRIFTRSIK